MYLSFLNIFYLFILLTVYRVFSFIKPFVVVVVWLYCCFLFFLKFSLSFWAVFPVGAFVFFGAWVFQLGFAVLNVIM